MGRNGARGNRLEEWRPQGEHHPVIELLANWCSEQARQGQRPPSPGGLADRVGIPRKLMGTWVKAHSDDPLSGLTLERVVALAHYTRLPLRELLVAGGLLSPQEPLYTHYDAYLLVAETLAHANHNTLDFDPAPVIAWVQSQTQQDVSPQE